MEKVKITKELVLERLKEFEDPGYREFHGSLLPGTDNILGVRLPQLRSLAKESAKEDWEEWFLKAQDTCYEETMLRGLTLAYAKLPLEKIFSYREIRAGY